MENKNFISLLIISLHDLHGKNGFAEILTNLTRYKSENNFC